MSFKGLSPILYGGREVWPLVEGGKGVSATNHASSGAWAAAGGIGTVSAVNADSYDDDGNPIPQIYPQATRKERFEQLVRFGIDGATEQVKRAYEIANGKGAININVLWEMGGAQQVLEGVLENCKGLITGVTCGAGMPYKLAEIAQRFNVHYLPIISSARVRLPLQRVSCCHSALAASSPGSEAGSFSPSARSACASIFSPSASVSSCSRFFR